MLSEFFSSSPISRWRFAVFILALAAAAWSAAMVPIPLSMRSRGFAELQDRKPIYISQTSVLRNVGTRFGGEIDKGKQLFEADAPEMRWEWMKLGHELTELQTRIRLLEEAKINDESANFQLPTLLELQSELKAKQNVLRPELESLEFEVPQDGFFVPQVNRLLQPISDGVAHSEPGHALTEERVGMVLERGMLTGWFTSEHAFVFHAIVAEADARWIQIGMQADAVLDAHASMRIPCQVVRIASEPLAEFPMELTGDGSLVSLRGADGKLRTETPHYLVVLAPNSRLPSIWRGSLVSCHFELPGKTLLQTVSEYLHQKFRTRP